MALTAQSIEISPVLRAIADIAYASGAVLMEHYSKDVKVRTKADSSPVTVADEATERFILAKLKECVPDVPVVAEESVAAGRIPQIGSHFFLVDPLDGTKEFIKHNGEFTSNIGEIVDGRPVRGAVYAPAVHKLYFGELESGAFSVEIAPGGKLDFSRARKICARTPPADGLVMAVSRSHADKQSEDYMKQFHVRDTVVAGSSLKFCLIAEGVADVYPRFGHTCEWDTAAGHAVLAAAGGTMTTPEGAPFVYGKASGKFLNAFFVARGK